MIEISAIGNRFLKLHDAADSTIWPSCTAIQMGSLEHDTVLL
jgi:hypothetical protein